MWWYRFLKPAKTKYHLIIHDKSVHNVVNSYLFMLYFFDEGNICLSYS